MELIYKLLIGAVIFIISFYVIGRLMMRYRKGGLFGVPTDLT